MKKLLILIIVVVVIGGVWWMLAGNKAGAPANDAASIESDLQGLTDADLDAEFKTIDDDSAKL